VDCAYEKCNRNIKENKVVNFLYCITCLNDCDLSNILNAFLNKC
jgi:hypothetical protein